MGALRFAAGGAVDDDTDSVTDPEDASGGGGLSPAVTATGGLGALDVPGASQAFAMMARSSAQARAALQRARSQIEARKYNSAIPLLAFGSALGAPTRTGSFSESFANAAGALTGPLREKDAFEQQKQKELLGVDQSLSGIDERTATAQLALAEMRAKLQMDAQKLPVEKVDENGKAVYRLRRDSIGKPAFITPPAPPTPQFSIMQQPLPDGRIQPTRVDARTGETMPIGEPYKPIAKLTGNAALQAQSKLGTIGVLKSQLQDIRDKWAPIKNTLSAGLLQGWMPSEAGKQFDKAVDAIRTTIRSLTRTPGEGSMSDWEGKLAQSSLPDRNQYESVSEQSFDQLERLANGYQNSTRQMLGMDAVIDPDTKKAPPPPSGAAALPAGASAAPPRAPVAPSPDDSENPDDNLPAVAPPEALAILKANHDDRHKALFLKHFGYLPDGY